MVVKVVMEVTMVVNVVSAMTVDVLVVLMTDVLVVATLTVEVRGVSMREHRVLTKAEACAWRLESTEAMALFVGVGFAVVDVRTSPRYASHRLTAQKSRTWKHRGQG